MTMKANQDRWHIDMINMTIFLSIILFTTCLRGEEIFRTDLPPIIKDVKNTVKTIKTAKFLLVKRELVSGKDTGYQYLKVKVQSNPLCIYAKFLKPKKFKGRECLYKNNELIVRRGGYRMSNLIVHLDPTGVMAMDGNRYPITFIDPHKITEHLINEINHALKYDRIKLEKFVGVSLYKHKGTLYRLTHQEKQPGQRWCMAEIIISKKLNIPIYLHVVNWNKKTVEEYAFKDLELNVAFNKLDFDENNPEYHLKQKEYNNDKK